jgi:hypothetical protein
MGRFMPGRRLIWDCLMNTLVFMVASVVASSPPLSARGDTIGQARVNSEKEVIRRAFAELADEHPSVRDLAFHQLMGLPARALPLLRDVVKESKPLAIEQTESLHDIVMQVFLAEVSYETEGDSGFLGVSFDLDQEEFSPECGGVEIRHRLPGFCAYRHFEDGDVLMAIDTSLGELELNNSADMRLKVGACLAGQTVSFKVLRRGRIEHISVVLNARPIEAHQGLQLIYGFMARRHDAAEKCWEETFEGLMDQEAADR